MLEQSGHSFDAGSVTDRVEFGAMLTSAREAAGLTVRDLARIAGVPSATVGGYLSGRHLPNPNQPDAFLAVLSACGIRDPAARQQWLDAVRRVRALPGPRDSTATRPYPGLVAFQDTDSAFFFGRSELIGDLVQLVDSLRTDSGRPALIAVIGPSGSGKSSLLRAGLIPASRERGATPILFTPGENPVSALAAVWAEALQLPAAQVEGLLAGLADTRGDADRGAELPSGLVPAGRRVLLVVDQAEELFSGVTEASERARFFVILDRLTSAAGRPVVAALALRADFYGAATGEPVLLHALRQRQVVVGPMDRAELREAVTAPAAAVGIHVDEALVQTLLDEIAPRDRPDLAHDAGSLPLLAHALHATWLIARRGRMTIDDYLATGGIASAVESTAEAVWAQLDHHEQGLARLLLLRLITVDGEFLVARRRVRIDEMRDIPSAPDRADLIGPIVPAAVVDSVLGHFVEARLLTIDADTVELSHEALLGAWRRLREWIASDRSALRIHQQLTESAQSWEQSGRDDSYLVGDGRLAVLDELGSAGLSVLNGVEREFVAASRSRRDQVIETRRRRQLRMRIALVMVAVLAAVSTLLAVVALRASRDANQRAADAVQSRDDAQSRELSISAERIRESNPALAAQLALVAYRIAPTVDATSALLDSTALPRPARIAAEAGPTFVAFDPQARILAVTNAVAGSVTLWSLATWNAPQRISTVESAQPEVQKFSVAISPDGRYLAVGSAQGLIERWDISDPQAPVALPGPGVVFPSGVLALAFSPDGNQIAAGGAGDVVQRWDVSVPTSLRKLPDLPAEGIVGALTYSPDGSMVWAGASEGRVLGWDASPGIAKVDTHVLTVGSADVAAVALSPDGSLLVAGDKVGAVRVWTSGGNGVWVEAGTQPEGYDGWVDTIAFDADGRHYLVGSTGTESRLIATDTGVAVTRLKSPGLVTSVAYVAAGTAVTASTDGFVYLWPLPGPVLGPVGATIFGIGLTPDKTVYVGATKAAGGLHTFDISDRARPRSGFGAPSVPDTRFDGPTDAAANRPVAVSGTADGLLQIWDTTDPLRPRAIGSPITVTDALVEGVAFNGAGTLVAVGSDDSTVHLVDVSDPQHAQVVGTTENAGGLTFGVVFQPGGTLLAAGTSAGSVRVWDIADPSKPRFVTDLTGLKGNAFSVDFSPDGRILVGSGDGREIRLWDMAVRDKPKLMGEPIIKSIGDVSGMRFTADGKRLVAGGNDGVIWVWDVSDPATPVLRSKLHAVTGSVNNLATSPQGDLVVAGGGAQRAWVWTLDTQEAEREICSSEGTAITESEWELYVADRPYSPPCA